MSLPHRRPEVEPAAGAFLAPRHARKDDPEAPILQAIRRHRPRSPAPVRDERMLLPRRIRLERKDGI